MGVKEPMTRRGFVGSLILAMALAGCAGGDEAPELEPDEGAEATEMVEPEEPAVEAETIAEEPDVVAILDIITELIQAAVAGAGFEPAIAGQELAVGDEVRSDESGFAEIVYHDGSWQRIEANATLTVLELIDDTDAATVRTAIDIGRTWNNVRELLSPDDNYELETPVATASVRGTIFATDCDQEPRCTFTAVEGTVEIDPVDGEPFLLTAPATVTLGLDDINDPETVFPDILRQDDWIATNLELDFDRAAQLPDRPTTTTDPARLATASLDGTYDVIRTIIDTNITEFETVAERVYRAETTCDNEDCRFDLILETVLLEEDGVTVRETVFDVTFDAGRYLGEVVEIFPCPDMDRTGVEGIFTVDLAPTSASRTTRGWHADGVEGNLQVLNRPDPVCFPEGLDTTDGADGFSSNDLEGTRRRTPG